jgi:hypothetical protein
MQAEQRTTRMYILQIVPVDTKSEVDVEHEKSTNTL